MKLLRYFVLLVCFVGSLLQPALAQSPAPAPTEQLVRIQSEGASGDVTAFFETSVTVDGIVYRKPWQSVSWNASSKTVTVDGRTLTYSEVMRLVVAIAAQERAAQKAAQAAQQNQPAN